MISPQKFLAKVIQTDRLTPAVYHLKFLLESPSEIDFSPGQRCLFNVGVKNNNYSLCSSAQNKSNIEICIDTTPNGPGSQWVTSRKIGDEISFIGPLGTFQLKETESNKIFLSTGTGISPFRSMLLELEQRNFKGKIRLFHGLIRAEEIFWQAQFESWIDMFFDFDYSIVLSQPGENYSGRRGYIQKYLQAEVLDKNMKDYEFYLCGNLAMITDVTALLNQYKITPERIISEKFY